MVGVRRFLLGGAFGLVLAAGAAGPAQAADAEADAPAVTRTFVGLWEAVDATDGSLAQVAITCQGPDACRVLGHDSYITLCKGKRGLLEGTGHIARGVLTVPGYTVTCFGGPSASIEARFTPGPRNGTITEIPSTTRVKPITFHRISQP